MELEPMAECVCAFPFPFLKGNSPVLPWQTDSTSSPALPLIPCSATVCSTCSVCHLQISRWKVRHNQWMFPSPKVQRTQTSSSKSFCWLELKGEVPSPLPPLGCPQHSFLKQFFCWSLAILSHAWWGIKNHLNFIVPASWFQIWLDILFSLCLHRNW